MERTHIDGDLDSFLQKGKIMVFSATYCPYCVMAKKALEDMGCNYEYIEMDENPITEYQARRLRELSGIKTIPNIFIGKTSIGGFSDLLKLRKNGELKNILKDNNVTCTKI